MLLVVVIIIFITLLLPLAIVWLIGGSGEGQSPIESGTVSVYVSEEDCVKDMDINRNEIKSLNGSLAPIPKGYNLEHNYEWLTYDNKEKYANQVIFKNGEKVIDIYYSKHESITGRPKCIYVPTSELKSSIIHNHEVKIVKDYSDNYSYVTSAKFTYNNLFYDIEFVNLSIEEIVSYIRKILK